MSEIKIEVDGEELEARPGEMLIQVTDRNGIYIPRFCYHDKLTVAANCRMCLVEVERAPKPMPACATPVMDGMKVMTRSKLAIEAQKGTMEFLLINHPLDCPVCDQGGECPLQDQAMGYGKDDSRFMERKRSVPSHDIGPLVATEMTRCIHCTRCVRFGEEVAGVMEMGAPGRGEDVKISTFLNRSIDSEVSGNIIDLCPVGALTSKPYRFAARSWELQNHDSISPHDCLGTNINIQTLRDQVERVLPIENPDINECWLADRDRFSYEAVNSDNRLTKPMVRRNGEWSEVEWEDALSYAAAGLKTVIDNGSGADLGGLAAPTSTLEEFYLLQKLLRSLGSENIDHRLQQCDFRDDDIAPAFPGSETPISGYSNRESVLLVGSNIRKEQPLLALRLREAWREGKTTLNAINPVDFDLNFDLASKQVVDSPALVGRLAALAVAVAGEKSATPADGIAALSDGSDQVALAQQLCNAGENALVVLGALAQQHADASILKGIAANICDIAGCSLAVLAYGNSAAGHVAGCTPGNEGQNVSQMLASGKKAFVLLNTEPELDCVESSAAQKALGDAEFVVQLAAFKGKAAMQNADVLLPVAAFAESAGTYINCEGRIQHARVAASPKGEARPAWKVLRVMGNFLGCTGFDQVTLDDVTSEIGQSIDLNALTPSARPGETRITECRLTSPASGLVRIPQMPMYRGDSVLRHAAALQATADNPPPRVEIHPDVMASMNLNDGDMVSVQNGAASVSLPVAGNARIPPSSASIPLGFAETAVLGPHCQVTLGSGEVN